MPYPLIIIIHFYLFRPDGREPGAEASSDSSAPEIVEQPPKEVAAVISEKLLIPLKATGAQLR